MKGRTLLASQDAFNFVALEVSVHAWQGVNRCLLLISNHSWCIDINLFAIPLFLEYSRAVDVLKLLVSCIEFARSNHFSWCKHLILRLSLTCVLFALGMHVP